MITSAPDGRGHTVTLARPPERIVSLVPSTTETLHVVGAAARVVGVTRFCVRPRPWVDSLPRIGGTKDVDPARVAALRPDLILGNCEENTREIFAALDAIAPVWAAFPRTVDDAIADLQRVAHLCDVAEAGGALVGRVERARAELHEAARRAGPFTYAALIWRRPFMTATDDTFLAAMLAEAGGRNVFPQAERRFPEVSATTLAEADPDMVLLLSEPFPFKARHADELAELTALPRDRICFVDGQALTWHGARMEHGLAALATARRGGFATRPQAR